MPRRSRTLKRGAVLAVVALGAALGLTGCTGGGASSPEELFKNYIAALNEGDYEEALSMVADPGEVSAESIHNFTGFEYKEPLLRGEPLESGAESGTLGMDLDGTPVAVPVEKRDGEWKLSTPVALSPFDFTERFAAFEKFAEVGEVSFAGENGDPITEPTGYSVLPQKEENTQKITVTLDGELVPDQQIEIAASALENGWPVAELELGELPSRVAAVATSLRYIDSHYDESAREFLTQEGPVTVGNCRVSEDYRLGSIFGFECAVGFPEKDFDGRPFLRRDSSEKTIASKSKYDNLREFSVRFFGGCAYGAGAQVPSTGEDTFITVGIQSGEAAVLWGDDLDGFTPAFNGGGPLSEEQALEECSGWAPERAGTVIQGLVPMESTDAGAVASAKL